MARPVTLMSAAILTAASGILPSLLQTNNVQIPPPPTAIFAVPSTSSSTPLTTPSLSGQPLPPNIAPVTNPAPGSPTIFGFPTALTAFNQSQSKVINLDNTPIVFERNGNTYNSNLLLRSSSGWKQNVSIDLLVLRDREGTPLTATIQNSKTEGLQIEPFAVVNQRLDISITSLAAEALPLLPASGWLRLLASPQNTDVKANEAADPKKEPVDPGYLYLPIVINEPKWDGFPVVAKIFFISFGIALLIVLITIFSLSTKRISLLLPMGAASWSFEQSWGANVTIGAALLTTFLSLLAFPSHPHIMEKASYSLLQMIFAAFIVLAPLIYGLIRRNVQVNANGIAAVDTQGYVIMFLIAGGLVLWGAFGQVITLGVFVEELILSGSLAPSLGRATQALAGMLCILLVVYGLRSLYRTVKNLSTAKQEPQPPSVRSGTLLTTEEQSQFGPPLPEWPLL